MLLRNLIVKLSMQVIDTVDPSMFFSEIWSHIFRQSIKIFFLLNNFYFHNKLNLLVY